MDDATAGDISLTESELTLLATVIEDGFPLAVLAATLTSDQVEHLKADALRLLSYGLVGVYGAADEIGEEEAHAVLLNSKNWLGVGHDGVWFIAATPKGDGLLAARGLGVHR